MLETSIRVSPLESIQIPKELVCEFFAAFARFEYALKESGFVRPNRYGRAVPDWGGFGKAIGLSLQDIAAPELIEAMSYLLGKPPEIQVANGKALTWQPAALRGNTDGAQVLDAVQRVRNNLFHGGKHTPHSPPGRDERLIRSSLVVLYACLSINDHLRASYEQTVS